MMTMMGYGSAIMVAVTMLASITLLPAMLGVVKHRVNSARVPFIKPTADLRPRRQVGTVGRPGRRPAGSLRRSSGAGPGHPRDPGVLDAPGLRRRRQRRSDSTTRKAYDLMADGYGPGTNGPLQVVLDADGAGIPGPTLDTRSTGSGQPARGGLGGRAGDQRGRRPGDHHRHPDHLAAGRPHQRAAPAAARGHHPRRGRRVRRGGLGHRLDGARPRTSRPGCSSGCRGSSGRSSACRSWC